MKLPRVGGLVVLVGLALVGAVVLAALGKPVPDFLSLVVVTGLGAVAGVAVPMAGNAGDDTANLSHVVAGLVDRMEALTRRPPAPGPLPTPQPVTDDLSAAPGVQP